MKLNSYTIQQIAKKIQQFSIVLKYHTKNKHSVDEVVFGSVNDGLLSKLVSVYDISDTKLALELK